MEQEKVIRRILVKGKVQPDFILQSLERDLFFEDGDGVYYNVSQYAEMGVDELHIKYYSGCKECGTSDTSWIKYDVQNRSVIF